MASSSCVISMTPQTPEVIHFPPITPTADTLIKTTQRGKLWSSTTEVPPKKGRKNILKHVSYLTSARLLFTSSTYGNGSELFWKSDSCASRDFRKSFV